MTSENENIFFIEYNLFNDYYRALSMSNFYLAEELDNLTTARD
jgi:hypothetical protein